MAYIYASTSEQYISDANSVVVPLPEHEAGDLLIVYACKDDAAGNMTCTSGWTQGGQANYGTSGTNTVRAAWWWKWAASGAETNPQANSSDSDAWAVAALTVKGAYYNAAATNQFIDIAANNVDATIPYTATSITTNYSNSLYIVAAACDGGVSMAAADLGVVNEKCEDSGTNGLGIAWTFIRNAGATGDIRFYGSTTADETAFLKLAIRDSGQGLVPAYPSRDLGTLISPFYGTSVYETGDAAVASNNDTPLLPVAFNPTAVFQFDASAATYVDYTTAATDSTDADVIPFPSAEATTDCFFIGYSSPFGAVRFDRAGCTAGAGGVCVLEYWNGTAWRTLSNVYDQTTNFTAAVGDYQILGFTQPSDWASTTLNGVNAYYIRYRITTVYSTNPTISQIWVGNKGLVYDALGSAADTGINPFHSSLYSSPGITGNVLTGANYDFVTTTRNCNTGILTGSYIFANPRDYLDLGPKNKGAGLILNLADASLNMKGWVIGSFGDNGKTIPDGRNIYAVQVAQTSNTALWQTSTAPNMTAVRKFLVAPSCYLGACIVYFNQLQRIDELTVNGGSSVKPVTFDDLIRIASCGYLPLIKDGYCYTPIHFGGDDSMYVDMKLFYLSYPLTAKDGGTRIHVDDDKYAITIDARTGDTLKIRNATLSGESRWKFDTATTANQAATYDFTGLTIVNANTILRDIPAWSDMSFINCSRIEQNNAAVNSCSFSGSLFVSNNPAKLQNNDFTMGSSGGHAIEITANGTYSFVGNIFTGYGADGTSNSAILNSATGQVTLNISGGGTTPTVNNINGSTTTINNTITLTLTGLVSGSEIRIYDSTTNLQLGGTETSGTSFDYVFNASDAGNLVYIVIFHLNYKEIRLIDFELPTSATSLPVQQIVDRVYSNPA